MGVRSLNNRRVDGQSSGVAARVSYPWLYRLTWCAVCGCAVAVVAWGEFCARGELQDRIQQLSKESDQISGELVGARSALHKNGRGKERGALPTERELYSVIEQSAAASNVAIQSMSRRSAPGHFELTVRGEFLHLERFTRMVAERDDRFVMRDLLVRAKEVRDASAEVEMTLSLAFVSDL